MFVRVISCRKVPLSNLIAIEFDLNRKSLIFYSLVYRSACIEGGFCEDYVILSRELH